MCRKGPQPNMAVVIASREASTLLRYPADWTGHKAHNCRGCQGARGDCTAATRVARELVILVDQRAVTVAPGATQADVEAMVLAKYGVL